MGGAMPRASFVRPMRLPSSFWLSYLIGCAFGGRLAMCIEVADPRVGMADGAAVGWRARYLRSPPRPHTIAGVAMHDDALPSCLAGVGRV
jgi:hypothetical protein